MGALNAMVWPEHLRNSLALCVKPGYLNSREGRPPMCRGERDMPDWVVCAQQS